jgi:hypothetical protein
MKSWMRLILFLAITAVAALPVQADDLSHSLVGTWRLISAKSKAVDGTVLDHLYTSGQLIYDSAGHMSVHLLKPSITKCGTLDRRKCPDAVAREAFDNYLGYWGKFAVVPTENAILHQIEGASVPDWVGTSQKRLVQISGKRLTVTTPPQPIGGVQSTIVLELERE